MVRLILCNRGSLNLTGSGPQELCDLRDEGLHHRGHRELSALRVKDLSHGGHREVLAFWRFLAALSGACGAITKRTYRTLHEGSQKLPFCFRAGIPWTWSRRLDRVPRRIAEIEIVNHFYAGHRNH